jgi:hypothetical protein
VLLHIKVASFLPLSVLDIMRIRRYSRLIVAMTRMCSEKTECSAGYKIDKCFLILTWTTSPSVHSFVVAKSMISAYMD